MVNKNSPWYLEKEPEFPKEIPIDDRPLVWICHDQDDLNKFKALSVTLKLVDISTLVSTSKNLTRDANAIGLNEEVDTLTISEEIEKNWVRCYDPTKPDLIYEFNLSDAYTYQQRKSFTKQLK